MSLALLLSKIAMPPKTSGGDSYSAEPIPGYSHHLLAVDERGMPAILIGCSDQGRRAPLKLTGVEVYFALPCRVCVGATPARLERLTAIVCVTPDEAAQQYFLRICDLLLTFLGDSPRFEDVAREVGRLVDLMQRIARPGRRPLIGILGELIAIHSSSNVAASVRAWRSRNDERFDFAYGNARLEIKAASDRMRAHSLSQEQCQPPEGAVGLLGSVFIEPTGGGLSMRELVAGIEQQLAGHNALIARVHEVLSESLGANLPQAFLARFDEHLARQSLQFYDLRKIPALRGEPPFGVSKVRFRSDLGSCAPVSKGDIELLSGDIKRLLPLSMV